MLTETVPRHQWICHFFGPWNWYSCCG